MGLESRPSFYSNCEEAGMFYSVLQMFYSFLPSPLYLTEMSRVYVHFPVHMYMYNMYIFLTETFLYHETVSVSLLGIDYGM